MYSIVLFSIVSSTLDTLPGSFEDQIYYIKKLNGRIINDKQEQPNLDVRNIGVTL